MSNQHNCETCPVHHRENLIRLGIAPAALVMGTPDAILMIGCLVAREMGWAAPPAFALDAAEQARLPGTARITATGTLTPLS